MTRKAHRISTVTLRFSPRSGLSPVSCALYEFESGKDFIGRTVPQLRDERVDAQNADIRIIGTLPPHVVCGPPNFGGLCMIAPHLGARRDREIGRGFGVNEDESNVVLAFDLVLLVAPQI